MSQRVRYTELTSDTLQSVRTYHTNDGINVRVLINTGTLEYLLVNDKNMVLNQGKGSYLHETKIKAKKALSSLGVSFSEENRNRTQENVG